MKRLSNESSSSDSELIPSSDNEAPSLVSDLSDSDEEQEYEKGVRIFRKKDQPEIDPDYHTDSSDEV